MGIKVEWKKLSERETEMRGFEVSRGENEGEKQRGIDEGRRSDRRRKQKGRKQTDSGYVHRKH